MDNVVLEPPLYFGKDHIFDVCFHPNKDLLISSLITGDVNILSYNSDDVTEVMTLDHHSESCRQSLFTDDGNVLATVSKDKSIGIVDQNGKLQIHMKNAHEDAINCGYFLNKETFASGDDSGCVKIWDLRNPKKHIFDVSEQDEAITGMVSNNSNQHLLSSSQDGTLGVYDLRKDNSSDKKLYALSDGMEEDLLSVQLIKNEQFVACSTSEGAILFFKWDFFGDFKDRMVGHPNSIDAMIKYDENTLLTGAEDGFARAVNVYPNDIIGTLGQHEEDEQFSIQTLSMSHCKKFLASSSHDSSIKFYDISYIPKLRQNPNYLQQQQQQQNKNKNNNDMEEEEKENNTNSHAQMKKKQQQDFSSEDEEDDFSDDDSFDENAEDSDMMSEDDDDDDDDNQIQQQPKKEKKKKRVMQKGRSSVNQRKGEIAKSKRINFFGNI